MKQTRIPAVLAAIALFSGVASLQADVSGQPKIPPQWNSLNYAQSLAGEIISMYPEFNQVGIYAKQPGSGTYLLAGASMRYKAGKKADSDDMAIINGRVLCAKKPRKVIDIGQPLTDSSGRLVGCLNMELKFSYTEDADVGLKHAAQIRDEVSKLIDSSEQLYTECEPNRPNDIYAQRLVDHISALHPESNSIGLHVIPPGKTDNVIIAGSSRIKIGKKSDPDDLDIMKPGVKPNLVPMPEKQITDTGMPLFDAKGNMIGTIVIEMKFDYEPDADKALKHAEEIKKEIESKIPSKAKLFTKDKL